MLMLSLLALPGTASAYTGGNGYPVVSQRPQLSAFVVGSAGSSSVEVRVSGFGFRPGLVFLSATEGWQTVSIQPMIVHANREGFFSQVVRIQQPFQESFRQPFQQSFQQPFQQSFRQLYRLHPTQIVLHATGQFGQGASQVLSLNWMNWFPYQYQGFQYGLIR